MFLHWDKPILKLYAIGNLDLYQWFVYSPCLRMVGQIEANSEIFDLLSSLSPRASGRGGNNEMLHISGFKSVHPMHKTSQSTVFPYCPKLQFHWQNRFGTGFGGKITKIMIQPTEVLYNSWLTILTASPTFPK